MSLHDVKIDRDGLIEWLREQPADRIVHDDTAGKRSCNCLVATYLQDMTGDNIAVAYSYADIDGTDWGDGGVTIGKWFYRFIHTMDRLSANSKVTAKRALEIVENYPA